MALILCSPSTNLTPKLLFVVRSPPAGRFFGLGFSGELSYLPLFPHPPKSLLSRTYPYRYSAYIESIPFVLQTSLCSPTCPLPRFFSCIEGMMNFTHRVGGDLLMSISFTHSVWFLALRPKSTSDSVVFILLCRRSKIMPATQASQNL